MTITLHRNVSRQLGFLLPSILSAVCAIQATQAQQTMPPTGELSPTALGWHSDDATELMGFPEVRPKSKGSLSISPQSLVFATADVKAAINRDKILSAVIGDVKLETGGTTGKAMRALIPFGGGAAVATVTNKQMDLLTIDFLDGHKGLHSAVFLLPKSAALAAQQQLALSASPLPVAELNYSCVANKVAHSNSITVATIQTAGEPVPAEYRALLYEKLLARLREENVFTEVYRTGDVSVGAQCPENTITLTLNAFKKGNAALRASTGPIGFFVGSTTLDIYVAVRRSDGSTLLDQSIKASKRGDTDSLTIADKIANSVAKKLTKASHKQAARS